MGKSIGHNMSGCLLLLPVIANGGRSFSAESMSPGSMIRHFS